MIDHDAMPLIAIAGGCGAVFLLLCIALVRSRRRVARGPRKTSFYMVAIDPSVAELGRAAFEAIAPPVAVSEPQRRPTPVVVAVPPVTPVHVALPAIDPPREPQRVARGSAPGIERVLPARQQGWEQHPPSVTARMRAVTRTR